jgi:hypothetical protein
MGTLVMMRMAYRRAPTGTIAQWMEDV